MSLLLENNVINNLKDSRAFFVDRMGRSYVEYASEYGCEVRLSKARLIQAHAYWVTDLRRMLAHDIAKGAQEFDQFKHAAFLCFWLRRFHPLESIDDTTEVSAEFDLESLREVFHDYGNEAAAVFVGMQLCINYTLADLFEQIDRGPEVVAIVPRAELVNRYDLSPSFEYDFVRILKAKNNSPHAINLMFRAYFQRGR